MSTDLEERLLALLKELPPERARRVLAFAEALVVETRAETPAPLPRGVEGKSLLDFAGRISPEDAVVIKQAIEKDCERVIADEW